MDVGGGEGLSVVARGGGEVARWSEATCFQLVIITEIDAKGFRPAKRGVLHPSPHSNPLTIPTLHPTLLSIQVPAETFIRMQT